LPRAASRAAARPTPGYPLFGRAGGLPQSRAVHRS